MKIAMFIPAAIATSCIMAQIALPKLRGDLDTVTACAVVAWISMALIDRALTRNR